MNIQKKGIYKKYLTVILAAAILLTTIFAVGTISNAETIRIGTVTAAKSLNMRKGPGTEYAIVKTLYKGDSGKILDEKNPTGTKIWYQMTVDGVTGWVSELYIKVTEEKVETGSDSDFEAYLTAQKFPESYKAKLRELHAKYPNWIFKAQHTGLKWDDVIAAESKLGRNLVHSSSISSWKSTADGAYDWETSTWIGFDTANWVAASSEIIEYYMDPRNFIDSTNVFQFLEQSYDASSMSASDKEKVRSSLTTMVKGTFLASTYEENGMTLSYIDVILSVAEKVGVSPYTLASMIMQEQGVNGTGSCISGTVSGYEGYYNYFNIGAYPSNGMTAIQRGLWYAKGSGVGATTYSRPWDTRTKSIEGGAKYYAEGYVDVGQDTMYLKKFDLVGTLYTHQYMTNVQGAASEGQHMAEAFDENARSAALVFKIPVFTDMPSSACKKPTGTGSPNYMLKSLSVSGYSLTPSFSMYDTSYSLIVENSVSSVTISAIAADSKASVTGTGQKALSVGNNSFAITVKSQSGTTRTYTIKIVRKEAESPAPPTIETPTVSSTAYKINSNNSITGITNYPVSTATFLTKLQVKNGSVKLTTSSGSTKSGNVGTGDQVRLYATDNSLRATYKVLIYGDVNGDGKINAQDLILVQKNNIQVSTLKDIYATAADVNRDGKINAQDLILIQKNNIMVSTIQQ